MNARTSLRWRRKMEKYKKKLENKFRLGNLAHIIRLLNVGKKSSRQPSYHKITGSDVEPMSYCRESQVETESALLDAEYKKAKGLNGWKKRNFI